MNGLEVAITGISGLFPRCDDINEFWQKILENKNLTFNDGDSKKIDKNYPVGRVNTKKLYDNTFNFNEMELEVIDPQLLGLLNMSYEALRDAKYDFEDENRVGVYISAASPYKWREKVNKERISDLKEYQKEYLYEEQYYPTQISYRLNLKGPSFLVLSGCSSSLVAVHQACRGLITGDCTTAIAGGICLFNEEDGNNSFKDNPIYSPKGICRPFDSLADGTVPGDGGGIIVLKLLEDAIEDGDDIYAVIKGSAVNNDGRGKVSFDSPSVDGQIEALEELLSLGEAKSEDISFVEVHGTGTFFGDVIEVEALTKAFNTDKKGYCAVGSIKPNIGYSENSSGILGLIKSTLAIKSKTYPATINFREINQHIDINETPFYINTENLLLDKGDKSILGIVNSIGAGGTNACVLLEELKV